MTDFRTPHGFVACVAETKRAAVPMLLYFNPKTYACTVTPYKLRRNAGIRVGSFSALVLGDELARIMRLELGIAIERAQVPRGTSELSSKSMRYYQAQGNAGRRSV